MTALRASTVVSTEAIPGAPLSRDVTICVASTRKPPPKMYGAENDPREPMNTSSVAPASAGVSNGIVTRRRRRHVPAPSPVAASSSEASTRSNPAATNRYTYTYMVYAWTNTIDHPPESVHGGSRRPSAACTARVTTPLSP
jgi:hypothetical protein